MIKKIVKKFAMLVLAFNFMILPFAGCVVEPAIEIEGVTYENTMFAYNGEEQSLLVTGDLPEGVTATYENNTHTEYGMYEAVCTLQGTGYITKTLKAVMTIYYDDKGAYDEDNYEYRNQLSDDTLVFTQAQKEGKFANGKTAVLLADQNSIDSSDMTKVGLSKGSVAAEEEADAYYVTSQQFYDNLLVDPPYVGNKGYLVVESKVRDNTTMYLSLKPSCTLEEFLEADYLEFYMYLYSPSRANSDNHSMTLSIGNQKIYQSVDVNTWVSVRMPLEIYNAAREVNMSNFVTSEGVGVTSKKGFYEYLSAGKPFLNTTISFKEGTGKRVYSVYMSDLNLKVAPPDLGQSKSLKNNFVKLNEELVLADRGITVLKNVYPRYLDNGLSKDAFDYFAGENAVKMDIPVNKDNRNSVNTLLNQLFIQVNSGKSYRQIAQYDALAVTIYVDSQNPHPYVARVGVTSQTTRTNYQLARFSANKWVTFEIPIDYLLKMYPYILNTGHYDVPGTGIRSNSIQELFYLTYEINYNGKLSRAEDIYSKVITTKTKWSNYPSRRDTHVPAIQDTWVQYPLTVYLKSVKLIKKA